MRERLIELQKSCCADEKVCQDNCLDCMADHLLANGVTVSQQTEPNTNADRIRAMSDEELAELFLSIIHERELLIIEKLNEQGIEASLFEAPNASVKAHLEWLKQSPKEEA